MELPSSITRNSFSVRPFSGDSLSLCSRWVTKDHSDCKLVSLQPAASEVWSNTFLSPAPSLRLPTLPLVLVLLLRLLLTLLPPPRRIDCRAERLSVGTVLGVWAGMAEVPGDWT